MTRLRKQRVPQEAFIGIVYAVAAAASILILSRAPEGGEELKELLVGHLLFIDWPEIFKIGVLYSVIGVIHWRFREPFLFISQEPQRAFEQGLCVRWWDFLFYATFGFVVTSSVEVAGVLLVFSFLIVPSVCAALLAQTIGARLMIGWVVGVFTSILGITASYFWDFPTGATIVCVFGTVLLVLAAARSIKVALFTRKR
jgi:zinc/manganese transport system permease protein